MLYHARKAKWFFCRKGSKDDKKVRFFFIFSPQKPALNSKDMTLDIDSSCQELNIVSKTCSEFLRYDSGYR